LTPQSLPFTKLALWSNWSFSELRAVSHVTVILQLSLRIRFRLIRSDNRLSLSQNCDLASPRQGGSQVETLHRNISDAPSVHLAECTERFGGGSINPSCFKCDRQIMELASQSEHISASCQMT
jgi:hypothetical protein